MIILSKVMQIFEISKGVAKATMRYREPLTRLLN